MTQGGYEAQVLYHQYEVPSYVSNNLSRALLLLEASAGSMILAPGDIEFVKQTLVEFRKGRYDA